MDFDLEDIRSAYLAGCIDTDRNVRATKKDWDKAAEAYCQYLISEKDPELYDSINGGPPKSGEYFDDIEVGEEFLYLKQPYQKISLSRGQRIGDGQIWIFNAEDPVNSLEE